MTTNITLDVSKVKADLAHPLTYMSLMRSPVMLVSSKVTSVVFQMTARKKYLNIRMQSMLASNVSNNEALKRSTAFTF